MNRMERCIRVDRLAATCYRAWNSDEFEVFMKIEKRRKNGHLEVSRPGSGRVPATCDTCPEIGQETCCAGLPVARNTCARSSDLSRNFLGQRQVSFGVDLSYIGSTVP